MSRKDKDFQRIKNDPKNVSKERLIAILKRFGCLIKERGKGSHFAVAHVGIERVLTIPSRKPIKTAYIKDCIRFIEDIIALENAGSEEHGS